MAGLSVDDVVPVTINMQPLAVPARNFGALLILGASDVIDISQRIRQYTSLTGVEADFGVSDPEYLAADLFFSQSPQPSILYIGRWAQDATSGVLHGAFIGPTQQASLLTALEAITSGSMTITIDSASKTLASLDFTGATNLNAVAATVSTALVSATMTWNASYSRFDIESHTAGTSSNVSYASSTGSGTDISALLGLTQATGATPPVAGAVAETPVQAVAAACNLTADIYGLMFAPASVGTITDAEYLAASAYVEGASPARIFGITTQASAVLDPTQTTDIASVANANSYSRTFITFSTSSLYAVASMYGRAFTVDFTANNSVITLKFKNEPGVVAETINETQAATLKAKSCNVFVNYNNGTAIIQEGVMSSGIFFDERHGTDWLANFIQTNLFNFLYQSPTKIPQTDPGVHQLVTNVSQSCDSGVTNGLIAPGTWTSSLEFGQLKTGDTLSTGYYVYAPPVATQAQSDREARKAPAMQVAIKLAGAVHYANVAIEVNR